MKSLDSQARNNLKKIRFCIDLFLFSTVKATALVFSKECGRSIELPAFPIISSRRANGMKMILKSIRSKCRREKLSKWSWPKKNTWIGAKKSEKIEVREVRRLTKSGHQTSIISTGYILDLIVTAIYMFSRWAQENFFKYMHQHYDFDKVMENVTEEISGPIRVVNPKWKDLDYKIRSCQNKLNYRIQKFGTIELHPETDLEKLEKQIETKADLLLDIDLFENELKTLKEKKGAVSKHLDFQDLPEDEKFEKLKSSSRLLLNTIKMIDYRAETAMSMMLKEFLLVISDLGERA